MPVLLIPEVEYDSIEANQEEALRWVNEDLALGVPALYDDGVGDSWVVFSHQFSLDQLAWWGCLMDNIRKVGRLWEPPKRPGSDDVDRVACAAEVQALIAADIVAPSEITYTHVVDVEVPIREYVEGSYVDEETGETVTYWYWRDTGETEIIQEVQALPNRWQVTLDAQTAPQAPIAKAADNVPDGWVPQEVANA